MQKVQKHHQPSHFKRNLIIPQIKKSPIYALRVFALPKLFKSFFMSSYQVNVLKNYTQMCIKNLQQFCYHTYNLALSHQSVYNFEYYPQQINMSRYVSKETQQEQAIMTLNFNVLQKIVSTIKRIQKKISFGIKLVYNHITGEWNRSGCEGPAFLIRCTNTKLKLIILNQLDKHNYIENIDNHMTFELKSNFSNNQKNYYLNIKILDSVFPTQYLSIWTTDPKIEEIYTLLTNIK